MWCGAPSQYPSRRRRSAPRRQHFLPCISPNPPPSRACLKSRRGPRLIAPQPRLLWKGTSGKRVPSGERETLSPHPPDGQGPGTACALRGARHKVCPERFGWFHSRPSTFRRGGGKLDPGLVSLSQPTHKTASSPALHPPPPPFSQPDPYRFYNPVLEGRELKGRGWDLALAARPRRWR